MSFDLVNQVGMVVHPVKHIVTFLMELDRVMTPLSGRLVVVRVGFFLTAASGLLTSFDAPSGNPCRKDDCRFLDNIDNV